MGSGMVVTAEGVKFICPEISAGVALDAAFERNSYTPSRVAPTS
jgi:hypothetical protein